MLHAEIPQVEKNQNQIQPVKTLKFFENIYIAVIIHQSLIKLSLS